MKNKFAVYSHFLIAQDKVVSTTLSWLNSLETPLHLRRRISSLLGRRETNDEDEDLEGLNEEEYEILLRRVYADKESKLLALRIGSYGKGVNDEESAWNGKDDPFVHLSADERQVIMKQMSIGEIKKAGQIQRRFAEKNKRKQSSSSKLFKKPSTSDQSPSDDNKK